MSAIVYDKEGGDGEENDIDNSLSHPVQMNRTLINSRLRSRLPLHVVIITGYAMIVSLVESSSSSRSSNNPNDWYQKYPAYPPYCSTPAEMKTRTIPLLDNSDDKLGATRLVHVTAVIRHGARTPLSTCWVGAPVETIPWDCNLTTLVATPSPNEIAQIEGQPSNPDALPLSILEKRYDALMDPEDDLSNNLKGTCQYGQLILQGYQQELTNGVHLRNAYIYDSNAYAHYEHDERMRLIDVAAVVSSKHNDQKSNNFFAEPTLRFRSDDDQRTVMSGQVLLQGMLGPEMTKWAKSNNDRPPTIPVHLADRNRDVVDPNNDICPRLGEIWDEMVASSEYKAMDQSEEAGRLRTYMQQQLGSVMGGEAIDCLMTTICTDRPLPEALNDYTTATTKANRTRSNRTRLLQHQTKTTNTTSTVHTAPPNNKAAPSETNVFQRIIDFNIRMYSLYVRYNISESAKLGMAPLWAEIMDNINPSVDPNTKSKAHIPKFALFSGHDDTIMPLLATLGPKVWDGSDWPPYASMLIIEIHEIIDGETDRTVFKSDFAFRLLYNGKILTHLMEGCPSDSDMCDVKVLQNVVKPFATRKINCARHHIPTALAAAVQQTVQSFSETKGLWVLSLAMAAFCSMISSILTCLCLRGRLRLRRPGIPGRQSEVDAEGRMALKGFYSDEPTAVMDATFA